MHKNPFNVLGSTPEFIGLFNSAKQLKTYYSLYARPVSTFHPDRPGIGNEERFKNMTEALDAIRDASEQKINEWIEKANKENLFLYSKFIETLQKWKTQILNYFLSKTTNGFVEGLNNKIKLIKRIGFGFTNIEHFTLRILQL